MDDFEKLGTIIHKMKGAAGNMRFNLFLNILKKFEEELRSDYNIAILNRILKELKNEYFYLEELFERENSKLD